MAMGTWAPAPGGRGLPAHPRAFRPEVPRGLDGRVARAVWIPRPFRAAQPSWVLILRSVAQARPALGGLPPPALFPPPPHEKPLDALIRRPRRPPRRQPSFVRIEGRLAVPRPRLLGFVGDRVVIGVLAALRRFSIIAAVAAVLRRLRSDMESGATATPRHLRCGLDEGNNEFLHGRRHPGSLRTFNGSFDAAD